MKFIIYYITFIFFSNNLFAQKIIKNEYQEIDKIALQLPDSLSFSTDNIAKYILQNFKTENEKSRAVFIWLASKIEYDIENMYAIDNYENIENKINKPLETKKGICENYALLFSEICIKVGIKAFTIDGYTRTEENFANLTHAWNAAFIEGTWYLFDPTWASGYVSNNKFYKKIDNKFYKVYPKEFIKTHIPFDYLWQFLNYPISNQEFYEGKTQENKSKAFFNYSDSINIFQTQDKTEQLFSKVYRIEKNGKRNELIFNKLMFTKMEIENIAVNVYNDAIHDFNDGIRYFNQFINYRNQQFRPKKPDIEIQKMFDLANIKIKESERKLLNIKNSSENILEMKSEIEKTLKEVLLNLKEQEDWLKLYFSKNKLVRSSMFYKYTWYGIPIN